MKRIVSGLLVFAVYWSMFVPFALDAQAQIIGRAREIKMKDTPAGLNFRLSEGQEGAEKREKQPPASTDPLSSGEAGKVLGRLPAIKTDANDQTDFAKRAGSLPPPKTGKVVPVKFPSDEGRGTPKVNPGTALEDRRPRAPPG